MCLAHTHTDTHWSSSSVCRCLTGADLSGKGPTASAVVLKLHTDRCATCSCGSAVRRWESHLKTGIRKGGVKKVGWGDFYTFKKCSWNGNNFVNLIWPPKVKLSDRPTSSQMWFNIPDVIWYPRCDLISQIFSEIKAILKEEFALFCGFPSQFLLFFPPWTLFPVRTTTSSIALRPLMV